MSNLIMIGGTMGIGKTTVSKLLYGSIDNCAYLEGDWVFNMSPFVINDNTRNMLHNNIKTVISNYFIAGYQNVILSWVLHEQSTIDRIIKDVTEQVNEDINVYSITLFSGKDTLKYRLKNRMERGSFQLETSFKEYYEIALDRMERSMRVNSIKIDTDKINPVQVKNEIMNLVFSEG